MKTVAHKFAAIHYSIRHAQRILIVAHNRPDPDTIGAATALYSCIRAKGKPVTIACNDPFPTMFDSFLPAYKQEDLGKINSEDYDVIIGVDNIDRGFDAFLTKVHHAQCVTIGIDHHPHTSIAPDILITNPASSSTCEIIHQFFAHIGHTPSRSEASALFIGIMGDTRIFHNPSTDAATLSVAANLLTCDIPANAIIKTFTRKPIHVLSLWGTALSGAIRVQPSGAIVSALTHDDLAASQLSRENLSEEIKEIASLLANTPHTPFAVILFQSAPRRVKGSLRAERGSHIDVAQIARTFGGGGHRLASGFEINGTIKKTGDVWQVTAA